MYLHLLQEQYQYLKDYTGQLSKKLGKDNKKYDYVIIGNYDQLKDTLGVDENYNILPKSDTLAIILTIEGGHSLGSGQKNTAKYEIDQLNDIDETGGRV